MATNKKRYVVESNLLNVRDKDNNVVEVIPKGTEIVGVKIKDKIKFDKGYVGISFVKEMETEDEV